MTKEIAKEVKEEIKRMIDWMAAQKLKDEQIIKVVEEILNFKQTIFLTGLGRSGFDAGAFGMRLAHLGYDSRVLRETTAPPVKKGDLFVVVSGGGEHEIEQTRIAREIGAKVIAITSQTDSTLAKLADIKLIIPGRSKEESLSSSYKERRMRGLPIFPLGTAFEDFAMIVLDAIISHLAVMKKKTEKDLQERHPKIA
ncbi:SIS domain-containing protein [Patescibacteria group bacterium]|nr:SIS domain-containing protein [Patescibacteria group bacterium]